MGLIVSLYLLVIDVILFLILAYSAFYALSRVSRYSGALNRFIKITAVSLLLATLGRFLDVVDDIYPVPDYVYALEEILYFLSILGVIYGLLNYIMMTERRLFPSPSPGEGLEGSPSSGAFLYMGRKDELFGFISSVSFPVLVFTRDPMRYSSLKHVKAVWITQASEKGISPTRLHVLLEIAVSFLREGGRLIVIDCVEILVVYNDFPSVFRFLTTLKDYVLSADASLLLHVDGESFEERQLKLLLREFERVDDLEGLLKTSS